MKNYHRRQNENLSSRGSNIQNSNTSTPKKNPAANKPKKPKTNYEISFRVDNSAETGTCPICRKPTVQDPSNIILNNRIFHFDCIVNVIRSQSNLNENCKILYIGSNTFGVYWESRNREKTELLKKINVKEVISEYVREDT